MENFTQSGPNLVIGSKRIQEKWGLFCGIIVALGGELPILLHDEVLIKIDSKYESLVRRLAHELGITKESK